MKYHYDIYSGISACGRVHRRPDTFLYDMRGFIEHINDADRCRTCKKVVKNMSKLGYVALSLMIIIDKWEKIK